MTYLSYDTSDSFGAPAELYRFTYWSTVYNYCTLDGGVDPITYTIGGIPETFVPTPIRRGAVEVTDELARNTVEINLPVTNAIAKLFLSTPPDGVVGITIYRFHITDIDKGYVTIFKGRVVSAAFADNEAALHCEPIFTSMRRPGLRQYYTSQCSHELYGNGCNLLRDNWEIDGTVVGINGASLTIQVAANYLANWFTGGVFRCGNVRRLIMSNTGTTVVLANPGPGTMLGTDCKLLPGCNHLRSDCHAKFNNIVHYNGLDWMPLKNPYSGDNIYFNGS